MQMRRLSRPAGSRSWWRGRRGRRATVRSASRRQRVRHPLRDAANFAVDLAATSGPVRTSREHLAGPLRSAVYARVLSAGKGDAIPGALFQLQPVPPQGAGFEVAERAAVVGIKVVDELFARRRLCALLVGSPGPDVDQAAVVLRILKETALGRSGEQITRGLMAASAPALLAELCSGKRHLSAVLGAPASPGSFIAMNKRRSDACGDTP